MIFSQDESASSSQAAPSPARRAADPEVLEVGTAPQGEVRAQQPQGRFSRRTVLKVAGVVGVGLGVGVVGREVYLLEQNHTLLTYRGHDAPILAVAWSPDSRWIASTSGTDAQVWEALSGRLLHSFPDDAGVETVAWSPDGTYLATGSWDRTVAVWQVATGQKVLTYLGHTQGQTFASIPHASLAKQAAQTVLNPSSAPVLVGIIHLAWSPDGTRLLSSGSDGTTQVWEARTGKTLLRFGDIHDFYEGGMWSPDGQHLLMSTHRGIERHLAATGVLESTFSINEDRVLALSPDGRRLAALSFDFAVGVNTIDLWDRATGRLVLTYEHQSDSFLSAAWSPDNRHVASAGYNLDVRVWNATTGQTEYIYRGHMNWFQLFFQGGWLPGTADASQSLWSYNSASALKSASALLPQDTGGFSQGIRALAWSPNGRYLASGGSDTTVQVWQPG